MGPIHEKKISKSDRGVYVQINNISTKNGLKQHST